MSFCLPNDSRVIEPKWMSNMIWYFILSLIPILILNINFEYSVYIWGSILIPLWFLQWFKILLEPKQLNNFQKE